MSLSLDDVRRIARLARIEITPAEAEDVRGKLDGIFELIQRLKQRGQTILLVEQNVASALDVATRAYVMANGAITMSGKAAELRASAQIAQAYLGGELAPEPTA